MPRQEPDYDAALEQSDDDTTPPPLAMRAATSTVPGSGFGSDAEVWEDDDDDDDDGSAGADESDDDAGEDQDDGEASDDEAPAPAARSRTSWDAADARRSRAADDEGMDDVTAAVASLQPQRPRHRTETIGGHTEYHCEPDAAESPEDFVRIVGRRTREMLRDELLDGDGRACPWRVTELRVMPGKPKAADAKTGRKIVYREEIVESFVVYTNNNRYSLVEDGAEETPMPMPDPRRHPVERDEYEDDDDDSYQPPSANGNDPMVQMVAQQQRMMLKFMERMSDQQRDLIRDVTDRMQQQQPRGNGGGSSSSNNGDWVGRALEMLPLIKELRELGLLGGQSGQTNQFEMALKIMREGIDLQRESERPNVMEYAVPMIGMLIAARDPEMRGAAAEMMKDHVAGHAKNLPDKEAANKPAAPATPAARGKAAHATKPQPAQDAPATLEDWRRRVLAMINAAAGEALQKNDARKVHHMYWGGRIAHEVPIDLLRHFLQHPSAEWGDEMIRLSPNVVAWFRQSFSPDELSDQATTSTLLRDSATGWFDDLKHVVSQFLKPQRAPGSAPAADGDAPAVGTA